MIQDWVLEVLIKKAIGTRDVDLLDFKDERDGLEQKAWGLLPDLAAVESMSELKALLRRNEDAVIKLYGSLRWNKWNSGGSVFVCQPSGNRKN